MGVLVVFGMVLCCATSVLLGVLTARRAWVHRSELRQQRHEDALRPLMLGFLDSGGDLPAGLSSARQDVLTGMLISYGQLVQGPANARVAGYMELHGIAERERAALSSRRA